MSQIEQDNAFRLSYCQGFVSLPGLVECNHYWGLLEVVECARPQMASSPRLFPLLTLQAVQNPSSLLCVSCECHRP